MHRPRQDGGTRKRHAQCLSRTLRNGKPQMRRKPWMMPVLWKWPVPVSGLWPVFRSASQWQSRRCRRRNRFKRYGKGMILLDIGKCVAVRIFRHRQIQAVHRELREPEAFVCRVGNGFFLSAGNFPALGHRAMLRRGSGNREQIRTRVR